MPIIRRRAEGAGPGDGSAPSVPSTPLLNLTPPPARNTPDSYAVPRPPTEARPLPRSGPLPFGSGANTGTGRTLATDLARSSRRDLQHRLHSLIIAEMRDSVDLNDPVVERSEIERLFNRYMADEDVVLNRVDRAKLFEDVCAEILGYGPIQQLLNDDTVSEIMVNGPQQVWIERQGKILLTDISFKDDEHVMRVISRIVAPLGRRIDESSPMVDARLPDGSRVNAIIPPLSLIGPVLTVRKFKRVPYTTEDMIHLGTISEQSAVFLEAAVRAGLNVMVAGGTGSGKTTFLNVLSSFIPGDERIVTIEDAAELQLQQVHVVPLESRPAGIEGLNGVSIRDLVVNCLRMRPDRIIVGECRSKEALDMLQAMNTGHDGCMTTVHSNSPRDSLSRVETMTIMAAPELPLRAIREQISSAFDLIVYLERMDDGSRKVTHITEVQGFEQDTILLQDIFRLETSERDGQRVRELIPTGIRPLLMRKLERARIFLAPDFFVTRPAAAPAPARNGRG